MHGLPLRLRAGCDAMMEATPREISFSEALRFWLKLGFISFGGPAGQIAIMHQELVERRRWISERRFLHALNYCMVLPGPEAQQLATYIGWLMHRTWGGIVAGGLFVLPSLFILIALSWIYVAYGNVPAVAGIFYGIKPAVTAIVLFAACRIGSRALKNAALMGDRRRCVRRHLRFERAVSGDRRWAPALVGYVGGRIAPAQVHGRRRPRRGDKRRTAPRVIDDDTPTPDARALFLADDSGIDRRSPGLRSGCSPWSSPGALGWTADARRRWAGSSPRRRCSRSAARTPCCLTCIRARSSTTAG